MDATGDSPCVCNLPCQVVMSATYTGGQPCCFKHFHIQPLAAFLALDPADWNFVTHWPIFVANASVSLPLSLFSRNKVSTCLFSFLFLCLLWHILKLKPLQVTNLKPKSPFGPQGWVEKTSGLTSCLLCWFSSCWLYFLCLIRVCAEISGIFSCSLGLSLTLRQFFWGALRIAHLDGTQIQIFEPIVVNIEPHEAVPEVSRSKVHLFSTPLA